MIWLIGNKGMLGTEVSETLTQRQLDFIGTDREVDITNIESMRSFVKKQSTSGKPFTCIINCAAYTNVNKAESDIELCTKLNVQGPANIAKVAKELSAVLIHISTDYVFDGNAKTPYTEEMEQNPTGVYGKTKGDGEKRIFEETDKAYIIRTAWLYGKHGNNFVFTMLRVMNENGSVKVVRDQFGTPTFAFDLARAIVDFAQAVETKGDKPDFGIYHFTNLGETNWFEFANEIYRLGRIHNKINRETIVNPCTTAEYPTPAPRPSYSVLSKDKISKVLTWKIPDWKTSLEKFIGVKIKTV